MTNQLAFHNTQFNVVNHNNQIWLTAVEIAKALCYKSDDAVTKIYNRNIDEFSTGMSETVNLGVSGNYQKTVRIFSLRGAHLIAMFARTPVAKEFRRWVLDVLDKEVGEAVVHPVSAQEETYTLSLTRSELCSICWCWSAAEYMREGLEQVTPGLIALRSPLADSVSIMASHYQRTLEAVKVILERETHNIKTRPYSVEDANWRSVLIRLRKPAAI